MSTKQTEALKLALDALRVARESVSEWSSYASDYFKDKYDLDGDFEAIDSSIEAIEAALAEQPAPSSHLTDEQKAANGLAWLARLEAMREEFAGLAEQPAQQEPVAWKHDCAALLQNDVELWVERCPHCGKPRTSPPASKPLTDEALQKHWPKVWPAQGAFVRASADDLREFAHGIKGDA